MGLERVQRQAEDSEGTRRCCVAVLDACFARQEWTRLNESVVSLAKKRQVYAHPHPPLTTADHR